MSGAAKLVMTSSSPVLTSVTVDVRMSSDNEVRKKRSAGRAASLGDVMEAAMADIFIVAFARRRGNEAGRKHNAQRRAEAKSAAAKAASAARANLWVRPDSGSTEIYLTGSRYEPLIR